MGGLWDAIRRHPDGPTESFEWYLRVRIRGAILDELRAQDFLPRRARALAEEAKAAGASSTVYPMTVVRFDDLSEWEQNRLLYEDASSESALAAKEKLDIVIAAIKRLPKRERYIVSRHYFRGAKFKAIGNKLGVTEQRISQIHAEAMARLRAELTGAPMPKRVQKPRRKT